ncbi:MAG: rRNA pseudouridine synthase [Lachnospiraceae bacterium]|nr:rRNA pseudouridine synthase [Lachnospiraceae bacterium]
MSDGIRINRYLAECGICSRREADKLIERGAVTINGENAQTGARVGDNDEVCVDGRSVKPVEKKVVLAYYKPAGQIVSESDPHAEDTVAEAIDYPVRVTYAGRLDKESEGLLLLTNDGELINAMMKGRNAHEKEYIVHLNKEPSLDDIKRLSAGIWLDELKKKTRPCHIEKIGSRIIRMILTEGLNRQIRRMWKSAGYYVRALKRIRVVNVSLGDLKPGEYTELDDKQLKDLYEAVGLKR